MLCFWLSYCSINVQFHTASMQINNIVFNSAILNSVIKVVDKCNSVIERPPYFSHLCSSPSDEEAVCVMFNNQELLLLKGE